MFGPIAITSRNSQLICIIINWWMGDIVGGGRRGVKRRVVTAKQCRQFVVWSLILELCVSHHRWVWRTAGDDCCSLIEPTYVWLSVCLTTLDSTLLNGLRTFAWLTDWLTEWPHVWWWMRGTPHRQQRVWGQQLLCVRWWLWRNSKVKVKVVGFLY